MKTFEIDFNNKETFQSEPMTKTQVINFCKRMLIDNNMTDDSYYIGYWDADEYIPVAEVSRSRRNDTGRVSTLVIYF